MLKKSLLALTFALTSIGCATSSAPRKFTQESVTAIRLDEVIRAKCDTTSSVTPVFEFSSSQLTPEAKGTLDTIATCFTTGHFKGANLKLVGFTDPRGTRSGNYELGMDRAESVAIFLEHNGMKRSQLIVTSRGEEGASPDPTRWSADRVVDMSVSN